MVKAALQIILFIAGFCCLVPIVPYLVWTTWAVTPERLELLLLSLPLVLWTLSWVYLKSFEWGLTTTALLQAMAATAFAQARVAAYAATDVPGCLISTPERRVFAPKLSH